MRIRHDIHIHTRLSPCGRADALVENYIARALANGLEVIGFSDHMWDSTFPIPHLFYTGQDLARICQLQTELKRVDTRGIRVLLGAEVEYDPVRRDLAITPEHARLLDFILVPNSHTHMVMPKEYYADKRKHMDFMYRAFMDIVSSPLAPMITSIAHPFCAINCPYGYEEMLGCYPDSVYQECCSAAAAQGIALELNLAKFRSYTIQEIENSNYLRLFETAKRCGCKFTFGSDAHTMSHLDQFSKFYVLSSILGLDESDLVPLH